MEFLKKRSSAIGIFIAVVIVFSLIGCHRSLSRVCRSVEDSFFDKSLLASSDYHTCPGDQLQNCVNYANRLLSVINSSEELSSSYDAISAARSALDSALASRDISDIYSANESLAAAVVQLDALVQSGAALPESNDDYATILGDFNAAQTVAASSPYNATVETFLKTTIRPFPTNILRLVSFVSLPEFFNT